MTISAAADALGALRQTGPRVNQSIREIGLVKQIGCLPNLSLQYLSSGSPPVSYGMCWSETRSCSIVQLPTEAVRSRGETGSEGIC